MLRFLKKTSCLFSLLIIPQLVFSQTYTGKLEILIVDYFGKNKSETIYNLHEGKEIFNLQLPKNLNKSNLKTGQEVIIEGHDTPGAAKNQITVESIHSKTSRLENLDPQIRKALTLIVNFADKPNIVSANTINKILYTTETSTKKNFETSSFNQVSFEPDTNQDGVPDIYNINLNYTVGTACDPYTWSEDAKKAATAAGIDISLYKHYVFVLPPTVSCSWQGVANLGCDTTCKVWVRSVLTNVFTHELGHNLGMNHAATDLNNDGNQESEYGDLSCIMGNANNRQVNAPHRDQMLWYENYPNQIQTVQTSGEFTLYPLDMSPLSTNMGLQVIKVPKKDNSATYYISYRKNIMPFGMSTPYVDKVNIHRFSGGMTKTYFITSLGNGQSFSDVFNNINIKVIETGGSTARLAINFD